MSSFPLNSMERMVSTEDQAPASVIPSRILLVVLLVFLKAQSLHTTTLCTELNLPVNELSHQMPFLIWGYV
jgi:hypothetical protein